jgi:RNA polymerase sigma factor (sigma-70 family)
MMEMERSAIERRGAEPLVVALSFEEFFEAEQERLLRILWIVTGSLHEAEDIVQDAFIRVWDRWADVARMESPVGYLHRTAMNIFRNRYRRTVLALRKAVGAAPESDAFGAVDDRVSIAQALDSLTPRQRAAVVLTEVLGYPSEDAGRMLGVGASTVRSLAHTGRNALRVAKELADD